MITNIPEYYIGLVEGSPNMVIAVDTSLLIVATNKPFSDFIKNTFGEIPNINVEVSEIISPDNESMLKDMINNFTNALIGESKTVSHKFTQGKLIGLCFEMVFYAVRNTNSEIIGAACVISDTTDKENLIISLEHSKRIFSLASRLAKIGAWELDVKNNIFIFNDEIYALYGTSVEKEGPTMSTEEFTKRIIHPDDALMVKNIIIETIESKELVSTLEVENRIIRQDNGETRIIKVLGETIKDKDGNIIRSYGTNQDITEQRETEEYLKKIQVEEEMIINSVPAWIFIKDLNNKYINVNKTYAAALGKSEEEIIGKTPFDFYPKEKAELYWKDDREVISTGVPKNNIVESLVTKNGVIWSRTERVPYRDIDGNIIGTIGFVVDVSQQKNAELDTETKNAELKNFNKLFMDRENKMIELKQEIEKLKQKSG